MQHGKQVSRQAPCDVEMVQLGGTSAYPAACTPDRSLRVYCLWNLKKNTHQRTTDETPKKKKKKNNENNNHAGVVVATSAWHAKPSNRLFVCLSATSPSSLVHLTGIPTWSSF